VGGGHQFVLANRAGTHFKPARHIGGQGGGPLEACWLGLGRTPAFAAGPASGRPGPQLQRCCCRPMRDNTYPLMETSHLS